MKFGFVVVAAVLTTSFCGADAAGVRIRRRSLLDPNAQLVSLDSDGITLTYDAYENESGPNNNVVSGGETNTVPDFSNVGYKGGGVAIPFVPTQATVNPGPGDDGTAIQNAINTVSGLPLVDGFRGAVLLKAGDYEVFNQLSITASGVVLRGEGSGVGGTNVTYTSNVKSSMINILGDTSSPVASGATVQVADNFVPTGAKTFTVTPGHGFTEGDEIAIKLTPNQAWLDEMSNMGLYGWTTESYQLIWRRKVESVIGDQIEIDAPVVQAIDTVLYGGADVYAYQKNEIYNVGVENIRLESSFASSTDENHGWKGIEFEGVRDSWVRQVTGKYFGYGLVSVQSHSSYITVEDSAMLEHKSPISGGRRYSFNVDDSDFVFFHRCLTSEGRHDYVSGSRTPGPNVFVDSLATLSNADIGPHHRYATGQLYDNIKTLDTFGNNGQIRVRNRGDSGSGHGWSGAQIMFWNCEGTFNNDAPNNAMNWAVGNIGPHTNSSIVEKNGLWRSIGQHVTPRSLYYAQLKDRLNSQNALRHVVLPDQLWGDVWTELANWYGNGLFLDPLITFKDEDAYPPEPSTSFGIGGIVRDLTMLGNSHSYTWSQVSGPGVATIADATAIETTASFSTDGVYQLQLEVSDGTTTHVALLRVEAVLAGNTLTPTPQPTEPPTNSPTDMPTRSPDSGPFEVCTGALEDTTIREANPTNNYAGSDRIDTKAVAGDIRQTFIKFDVSGVTSSVEYATLRLFGYTDGADRSVTTAIYELDNNNWSAGTSTWDSPGAATVGGPIATGASPTVRNDPVDFDLTSLVNANIAASQVSLAIYALDGTSVYKYWSTEAAGEGVRPVLCTLLSSSSPAPTPSGTAAPTKAPTGAPTKSPTAAPTSGGTGAPTKSPTFAPTKSPTPAPSAAPTKTPTPAPSASPVACNCRDADGAGGGPCRSYCGPSSCTWQGSGSLCLSPSPPTPTTPAPSQSPVSAPTGCASCTSITIKDDCTACTNCKWTGNPNTGSCSSR